MKANEAPETYSTQFKDKLDEYLWKEHHILGGCCSSIESMKYAVAREVAEKLTDAFIEKVSGWLKDCATFTDMNGKKRVDEEMYKATVEDFKKYMKGE